MSKGQPLQGRRSLGRNGSPKEMSVKRNLSVTAPLPRSPQKERKGTPGSRLKAKMIGIQGGNGIRERTWPCGALRTLGLSWEWCAKRIIAIADELGDKIDATLAEELG